MPLAELPFALSFTAINDYLVCPKRFYHKHLAKDIGKETKTGQQLGGTAGHEALRKRIKLREPLPAEFKQYEPIAEIIQDHESIKHCELKLGIDVNGRACDFFAPEVKLRGALDLAMLNSPVALILDYKSGKPWEDPLELKIGAVLLQARYPDLNFITGAFVWLREARIGTVYRINTEDAWAYICTIADAMRRRITTLDWPADEGPLCPWCPVPHGQPKRALDPVCQHRKDRP